jgi:Type II secretion system (T2SS), protein E, N-terminal domain
MNPGGLPSSAPLVPRSSDDTRSVTADTNNSTTNGMPVTPELVLVDPQLANAQRQNTERKAVMSSPEPANGFFGDQAQPAPPPAEEAPPATPPAATEPKTEPASPTPPPAAAHAHVDPATPMVDVPLGTLIFRAGLLAEQQLEEALHEGMRTGKRLGEVLIERGWLNERDLGRMLAGQKGLPFVEVSADDAEHDALKALPEETARRQVALPLRYDDGELIVAVGDPSNQLVLENLRRSLESSFRLVVAPHGELLRAIGEAYARPAPEQEASSTQPEPELHPEPEVLPQPEPVADADVLGVPEPLPPPELPAAIEPQLQPASAEPVPAPQPVQLFAASTPALLSRMLRPADEQAAEPAVVPPPPEPAAEEAPAPVDETVVSEPEPPAPSPEMPPVQLETAQWPEEQSVQVVEAQPETRVPPTAAAIELPDAPAEAESARPAAEAEPQETEDAEAPTHVVLVRLRDGETLQLGTFQTAAEASAQAQDAVTQISSAGSEWPFFAGRYLRPDTIVSVDLLEEKPE